MALTHFDNIIGQEMAVSHLQNALRTGQISQAYIFSGEKGSGKMDLALAFASALQCTNRQEEDGLLEPCGECHSCIQMASLSHPDVIIVTNDSIGAETKTDTVGVKAARFIQGDVAIKPYEGPYKIYIIPDADKMNQQAQNALLKTLEEPPGYAVFLLLSSNTSSFLPTVMSRCVTLRLQPAPEEALLKALAAEGIEGNRAMIAARLSHGNPGRCFDLARSEELEEFRKSVAAFLKRMPDVTSLDIVQYAEGLTAKKKDAAAAKERPAAVQNVKGNHLPGKDDQSDRDKSAVNPVEDFLDMAGSWFRDILICRSTKKSDNLIFRDEVQYISTIAGRLPYSSLEVIQEAFDEARRRRRARGNDTQILEVLLLKIRSAMRST